MARGLQALCVVFLGGAVTAHAAEPSVHDAIHVERGATCLDQAALREQVRSWLDVNTIDSDLRVDVEGSERDERSVSFRVLRGEQVIAERAFSPGPSQCAQFHAVVGLAIALALKVSLRDELIGDEAPPPRRKWSVGAAATVAWNVIPGVAGGAVLWGERAFSELIAVRLALSGLAGGGTAFERVSGEFLPASIAVRGAVCAIPRVAPGVRGRFCAGIEARTLLASGSGFAISKDAVLDWFSLVNSVGAAFAIAPAWSLLGTVGVVMPLQKVQIAVTDPSGRVIETRESTPFGGELSFGAAYEF